MTMKRTIFILAAIIFILISILIAVRLTERSNVSSIATTTPQPELVVDKNQVSETALPLQTIPETPSSIPSQISEKEKPIELEQDNVTIKGKIVNDQKEPIKNAKVEFVATKLKQVESESPQQQKLEEKSDEKGQYSLILVKGDYIIKLTASADGYVENSLSFNISSKGSLIDNKDIILKLGKIISGIVVNEANKPILDAEVSLAPLKILGTDNLVSVPEVSSSNFPKTTKSDKDGKFSFNSLGEDKYALLVNAKGYEGAVFGDIPAGKTDLKIVLEEGTGGRVLGKVINKSSTNPIPETSVTIIVASCFQINTKTDSNGDFEASKLPVGPYRISARKDNLIQRLPKDIYLSKGEIIDNIILELEEPYTISGKVLEKGTNAPIPNAKLEIINYGGKKETISNANGDYIFKDIVPPNVSYPVLTMDVFSDNFIVDYGMDINEAPHRRIMLKEEHQVTGINIFMKKGVQVSGIVLTPEQKPVPVATIHYMTPNARSNIYREYTTDQSGRFITVIEPNTLIRFSARIEGYAETVSDYYVVKDKPINDVVLVLKKGPTVEGKVLKLSQTPVPDANVFVLAKLEGEYTYWSIGYQSKTTDKDGKFKFENVTPGKLVMYAESKDYGKTGQITVELKDNEQVRVVNLIFGETLSISGKVMDENKKPLSEVYVSGYSQEAQTNVDSRTDEKGNYELKGLKEGNYQLVAQLQNYVQENKPKIKAGSTNVDFILKINEKVKVRGKVVEKNTGHPVPIFTIIHEANRYEFNDPEGKFEIKDGILLPTQITVSAEDYLPTLAYLNQSNIADLTIVLDKGVGVKGRILSKKGNVPLNNVKVSVSQSSCCPYHDYASAESVFTKENGEFYIEKIHSGHNNLYLETEGFPSKTQNINLVANKTTDLGDIFLGKGGRIYGTVYDENTKPLQDVVLNLTISQYYKQLFLSGITDKNGSYEFKDLPSGGATIFITKIPNIFKSVQLDEEEERKIDLYLTKTVVNVQVFKKDEPLQNAFISGHYSEGDYFNGTTDENGKVSMSGMLGVQYTITINYNNSNVFNKEVEVKENVENNFVFEISDSIISGKILNYDGKPIPNIYVYLNPDRSIDQGTFYGTSPTNTDNEGYFEFQNLPEGDYIITASINNQNSKAIMKKISLAFNDQITNLVLRFGEGTVLNFVIRDKETNAPLKHAGIILGSNNVCSSSDNDGKTSMTGVPAGEYKIRVYANGYLEFSEDISIIETQILNREFLLSKISQ